MQQGATHCNQDEKKQENPPYQQIVELYNAICVSLPHVTKLSDARKKAISARCKKYSFEDFRKIFEMAEESSFLKGSNNRNWVANFDWLIRDSNMAKVLDGNYTDRTAKEDKNQMQIKKPYQQFEQREYNKAEMDELEKKLLQNGSSNATSKQATG